MRYLFVHESVGQPNDFSRLLIQREMACVENMDLGRCNILLISLSPGDSEGGIVAAPQDQHRRPMLTKPPLPRRIRLHIVLIIEEEIRLNVRLSWLIKKIIFICPRVRIDSLRMRRTSDVAV